MKRDFRRGTGLFPVLLSLSLAACGGGGGTSSPNPDPAPIDHTPDKITFAAPASLLPGTLATSAEVTIAGLDEAVQASISAGGEISVNGGPWTAAAVSVRNGDAIRVRGIAADTAEAVTELILTVGEGRATFNIPTAPAGTVADSRPENFALPAPANVEPGVTITSEPVVVSGVNTGTPASVSGVAGAVLLVDGVPVEGGGPVTVFPGQIVQVSLPAPAGSNGVTEAVLGIGDISTIITLITPPANGETDNVPEPFAADVPVNGGDPSAAEPGQTIVFGPLIVSGVAGNVAVDLDGPGGYSLDGGGSWSNDATTQETSMNKVAADTVTDGNEILVRLAASEHSNVRTEARLTVGGVSKVFAVTTRVLPDGTDTEPEAFEFAAKTGVAPGSFVISDAVIMTGLDAPAAIGIENGEYRINGGQFTAVSGVITARQTLELRVTAADEPEADSTAIVTVGGVSATFTVTTANEENQPPTANAGSDQQVSESVNVGLNGIGSTDPEDGELTFAWTQTAGPAVTLNHAKTAVPAFQAPTIDVDTALTFELAVTDLAGLSDTDSVTVHVTHLAPGNTAPTAHAGEDATVNEGAEVTLHGTGNDAEDDVSGLTFAWTAPAGITLSDASATQPTFTAPDVTSDTRLAFVLTVTDSEGATVTDDVVILVHPLPDTVQANWDEMDWDTGQWN